MAFYIIINYNTIYNIINLEILFSLAWLCCQIIKALLWYLK